MKRHYQSAEGPGTACCTQWARTDLFLADRTDDWSQVTCGNCRKVYRAMRKKEDPVGWNKAPNVLPWAKKVEARTVTVKDEWGHTKVVGGFGDVGDPTEPARRELVAEISSAVATDDKNTERKRLEALHGQVWDTDEMTRDFEVEGFMAPFIVVRRKADGQRGSLLFVPWPRLYYSFKEDRPK